MAKIALLILPFFFCQAAAWSQSSLNVCHVTINEKPYLVHPGKDSLTKEELIKASRLLTVDNKYTIISFQVLVTQYGDFGFIVHGNNLGNHYYASVFYRLSPGNRVKIECVQVKDKNGQRQVLADRTFYIVADKSPLKTDSLR